MNQSTRIASLILLATAWASLGCLAKQASTSIGDASQRSVEQRAVIRSGSLGLRARDIAHVKAEVERLVAERKGWVESWSLDDTRWLHMTLRVPEPTLEQTMEAVSSLGKVVSRSLSSLDVTEDMVDLDTRLSNLKALRDRLRAYLDRASDLKEILEVERELVRVQIEIESIEGKLKLLRSRVSMSELKLWVRKRRF